MLEEQNDVYMKKSLELEDTAKQVPVIKTQLERSKTRATELASKIVEIQALSTQQDSEVKKLTERNVILERELQQLKEAEKKLEKKIEELKSETEHEGTAGKEGNKSIGETVVSDTPEIKEKLLRLEIDNQKLRQSALSSDTIIELESKLDDAERLNKQYKEDIQKYTIEIKELKNKIQNTPNIQEQLNTLIAENDKLSKKIRHVEAENDQHLLYINNVIKKNEIKDVPNQTGLEEQLIQANNEKKRLENLLKAAKGMITELRSQTDKTKSTEEKIKPIVDEKIEEIIINFKTQLKDKDKEIHILQQLWQDNKESSQREQQLIVSAFYEMGLELARSKARQPLSQSPLKLQAQVQPTSFLGKKRMAQQGSK